MEAVAAFADILTVARTACGPAPILFIVLVESNVLPWFAQPLTRFQPPVAQWKESVAGQPGIWELYPYEDPPGLLWVTYTLDPLPGARHVALIAFHPNEGPLGEATVRTILLSVRPCPPASP